MNTTERNARDNRTTDRLVEEYLSRNQDRVAYINYDSARGHIVSGSYSPGKTIARFTSYPRIDDVRIALLSIAPIPPTTSEVEAMQREDEDEAEESWYTWLHPVATCERDY